MSLRCHWFIWITLDKTIGARDLFQRVHDLWLKNDKKARACLNILEDDKIYTVFVMSYPDITFHGRTERKPIQVRFVRGLGGHF